LLYEHPTFRAEFKNKFGPDLRDLLASWKAVDDLSKQ
jgi:hypothetical protein